VGWVNEVFGPDDQKAFEQARDRLIEDFGASGGDGFERVAEQVLDFKWGYLDGNLLNWSPADLDEVLFGLYPAKVLIDGEAIADVPAGFASFLRFLAGRRPDHSPPLEVLAEYVELSASRFISAMNDEDRWSFGKRMWSTALAEGVELSDEDAIGRWMEDFNSRTLGERDQILGRLPASGDGLLSAVFGSMPPVVLAPNDELRTLAADTALVRRLTALVRYCGAGRTVTDRGNLKLADGKELVDVLGTDDRFDEQIGDRTFKTKSSEELSDVDWTYRIALETLMLETEGTKLLPGANADWVDTPLDVLYGALLVMLKRIGPTQHRYRKDNYGWGWYAEELDTQLTPLLLEFYRHREPRDVDELAETMWGVLEDEYDLSDVPADKLAHHRILVENALRHALDRLEELGIVKVAEEIRTTGKYGTVERSGGVVQLSPLGLWAMQRMAAKLTDAPIVGALRDVPAAELLRATGDLADDMARGEIDAWVDHHGHRAADELCAVLPDADETGRGLGFRALLRIGTPAAATVEKLGEHPDLADFVTVFRVDTLAASPDEMDRAGDPEGWVRLLHTVIELWGPDSAAAAWAVPAAGDPGIDAMLNTAWRVPGLATGDVLAALGGHHPDKRVAKAARKALFKYRSAS
jgi:DNA-binding transcriptional ArsR family regulator